MAGGTIEHTLWVTQKINQLLGLPVEPPAIPDHVVQTVLVIGMLVGLSLFVRSRLSLIPSGLQNIIESFFDLINGFLTSVIGPKGPRYFPLITTLALFILLGNLIGLFPFCKSPTSNLNVTLACALVVFFYYHYQGIKDNGLVKYLKHFAGPMPAIAPLLFPLELISHTARVMSLSIRLFGNIMGEDIIIIILFILVPYIVPIPMMMFAIFTSFLQAFIFVMLSMMYIAGAVAEEEH
ncbi:F0F1 ATP synthase subunit A [bacterium]|nr:F0F1 ATP synthase subunit A [candidate division CSSED10-310 bacterium]